MLDRNSPENVFRFTHLRPPMAASPGDHAPIVGQNTQIAKELTGLSLKERAQHANTFLKRHSDFLPKLQAFESTRRLLRAVDEITAAGHTVEVFRQRFESESELNSDLGAELQNAFTQLSAFLLAAKFAPQRDFGQIRSLTKLFRAQYLVLEQPNASLLAMKLNNYLRRPLALPDELLPRPAPGASSPPPRGQTLAPFSRDPRIAQIEQEEKTAIALHTAVQELLALNRAEFLHVPRRTARTTTTGGEERAAATRVDPGATLFVIRPESAQKLSSEARKTLEAHSIDLGSRPLPNIIEALEAELALSAARLKRAVVRGPGGVMVGPPSPIETRPYLKDSAVADLLVVKQHLKRYERIDIAHIENVLKGEKKSRNHRALERTEETLINEEETVHERETELETAERFELHRETERTAKLDQAYGFGLSLSGKYGPTVEFSSNAQVDINSSSEERNSNSTNYAKDLMSRSLDRVVERVREERIRTVIREQEETNLHELENKSSVHVSGVYQFVEKVYESQVFNYGIRQMFDFMIPEPASYIWHIESQPETQIKLPDPIPKLELLAADASGITPGNYLQIAAIYGAEGLTPPPPLLRSVPVAVKAGDQEGDEDGRPQGVVEKEFSVPTGYIPLHARVSAMALTDDDLTLAITIGHTQEIYSPRGTDKRDLGGLTMGAAEFGMILIDWGTVYEDQAKMTMQVVSYESHSYAVSADVIFLRADSAYQAWQIKAYDAIATAYQDALLKREAKIEELQAKADAEAVRAATRFGAPPSQNMKIIKEELKKHCLAVITRQRFENYNGSMDNTVPPAFDFISAQTEGSFIRFFEHAFEWDQIQYVFYPYFWARQSTWAQRFMRSDVDPQYLEFLRAGEARVVVPVRPGFEVAVTHYLDTGEIWNGLGDAPDYSSSLYLPILNEIQERTGADQGEIAVGNPWSTHLPTPLVILRANDDLPKWRRMDDERWEWEEES